jgi:hypothetical protein
MLKFGNEHLLAAQDDEQWFRRTITRTLVPQTYTRCYLIPSGVVMRQRTPHRYRFRQLELLDKHSNVRAQAFQ